MALEILTRIYIFQNLNDIPNLHGLEDDSNLSDETVCRVSGFKAFR